MAIRFRYRSSPHFETIDLAGAGSASVRNLRARILGPALRCHFDLLISYAASNHILDDDALLIPAGSDLVIKRVPIEFVDGRGDSSAPPQDKAEEQHGCGRSDRGDGIASFPPPLHNFDDTDKALCPGLEAESYADVAKVAQSSEKRYLNIEGSGLSEAMPEEIVMDNSSEELGLEEGKRETKTSFKAMEPIKMEQSVAKSSQVVTNIDSPAELRCFLCKSIFEAAVMIPCCQHSFCSKCIVFALAELNKCPKCSSTRCTANDLLPNLSLRKAIKHFLDDLGPVYAPDVESCVEEKESSCPLSIHQQEQNLLCSPSAIGKDSNQLMPIVKVIEKSSSIKICLDGNKPTETAPTLPREAPRNSDFQGSASSSKVYQNIAQDSGDLRTIEAKALRINSWDADGRGFATPAIRARKGGRTCYRCGSPNHLIRYCPVASNVQSEDSALHGDAYGPPNWQGSMFHPLQPYGNMYGTPEIISFDPGVVPVSPFGVPSYMPSFSGGMQNPYAFMGMRSMPSPMLPGVQQPLSHTGLGIHDNVKSQNAPSERGVSNSADYHDGDGRRTSQERYQPEKSYERGYHESNTTIQKRHHKDKYCSPAHENLCYSSDDELVDQKHRKELGSNGREMRSHYTKQSASEVHDIPNISIPDTRQRNKQHDRSASGKRDEIRAKSKSEYTENTRHQSHKENIRMDRSDDGHKSSKSTYGHKHRVQETYYATDYKHDSKIKRSSQSSRHDKTKVGSSVGHVGRDRWAMEDGRPDDYERRDHYRHKTKRRH